MSISLKEAVFDNLNRAKENGYDLLDWSPEEITIDLRMYASDMEDFPSDEIVPYVVEWLEEQQIAKAERG